MTLALPQPHFFPFIRVKKKNHTERTLSHLLSLACLGPGKKKGFVGRLRAVEAMEDKPGELGQDQILKSLY